MTPLPCERRMEAGCSFYTGLRLGILTKIMIIKSIQSWVSPLLKHTVKLLSFFRYKTWIVPKQLTVQPTAVSSRESYAKLKSVEDCLLIPDKAAPAMESRDCSTPLTLPPLQLPALQLLLLTACSEPQERCGDGQAECGDTLTTPSFIVLLYYMSQKTF